MILTGLVFGLTMLAAGVAIGEALERRRSEQDICTIHDEWDAACRLCAGRDMPRTRQVQ